MLGFLGDLRERRRRACLHLAVPRYADRGAHPCLCILVGVTWGLARPLTLAGSHGLRRTLLEYGTQPRLWLGQGLP